MRKQNEKRGGLGSRKETAKSADVYESEGDERSASYDCDVILVGECVSGTEVHISETRHV